MDSLLSPVRWIREHPETWAWIALASIGAAVFYAGILLVAVVRMRPDYFSAHYPPPESLRSRFPLLTLAVKGLKTVIGLLLLVTGFGMLVLPGQGLATITIAITFLEFPGKKRLLAAIVFRGGVLKKLNGIRARAGREPLRKPEDG